jgi:hypothetical protein
MGTSSIAATSSGTMSGIGVGSYGAGLAFGTTSGMSTGTHQTAAARQAAPPKKKEAEGAAICIVLGIGALIWFYFSLFPWLLFVVIFFLWAGINAAMVASKWNRKKWPMLMFDWLDSFRCLKCGQVFRQSEQPLDPPDPEIERRLRAKYLND